MRRKTWNEVGKGGGMKDKAEGCKVLWCRWLLGGKEGEGEELFWLVTLLSRRYEMFYCTEREQQTTSTIYKTRVMKWTLTDTFAPVIVPVCYLRTLSAVSFVLLCSAAFDMFTVHYARFLCLQVRRQLFLRPHVSSQRALPPLERPIA